MSEDYVLAAMRELIEALNAVDAGMPVDSSESAGAWFGRADRRVTEARAKCADVLTNCTSAIGGGS